MKGGPGFGGRPFFFFGRRAHANYFKDNLSRNNLGEQIFVPSRKMKRFWLILLVFVAALIGAVIGAITTFNYLIERPTYNSIEERQQAYISRVRSDSALAPKVNFKPVTSQVIKAVVHVRISLGAGEFSLNPLDHYYNLPARSSGSGVIISDDGYISFKEKGLLFK